MSHKMNVKKRTKKSSTNVRSRVRVIRSRDEMIRSLERVEGALTGIVRNSRSSVLKALGYFQLARFVKVYKRK